MRWRSSAGLVLTATLVITACTSGAGSPGTSTESPTTAASGPGGTAPAGATAGSSAGASQANGTVEGSITTGEPYAATWTWQRSKRMFEMSWVVSVPILRPESLVVSAQS